MSQYSPSPLWKHIHAKLERKAAPYDAGQKPDIYGHGEAPSLTFKFEANIASNPSEKMNVEKILGAEPIEWPGRDINIGAAGEKFRSVKVFRDPGKMAFIEIAVRIDFEDMLGEDGQITDEGEAALNAKALDGFKSACMYLGISPKYIRKDVVKP